MKIIFTDVINSGGYKLNDMISKIESYHIQGKLTDGEKTELITLARSKAGVGDSVDILKKLEELDARVKALEEDKTTESTEEYPPFVDGKWYYRGDKCSEDNINYNCIAPEGVVCVWSPSTYPAYWEVVK